MTDKQAEIFVKQFASYLLPGDVYINMTEPGTYTEGSDWQSLSLFKRNGDVEVKRISNYLTRGNDNDEPSGTIPFELFQCADKTKRDKWYGGWLLSICNAFWYTLMRKEIRERQSAEGIHVAEVIARTPGALVMILTAGGKQNPFACVAFEKIPELITRLCELCPDPAGWGLTDPDTQKPATNRTYWKKYETWNNEYGKVIGNMWHVPFREITNLATVTMIGKAAEIVPTFTNSYGQTVTTELQRTRLNTLREKAKERGTMSTLIPEEATAELTEAKEKMSKKIGVMADKLYPVDTDELREKLYDPEKLEEMKAVYDQAIQKHNAKTGDNLPTWDERNRRMIEKAQQRISDQARTEE